MNRPDPITADILAAFANRHDLLTNANHRSLAGIIAALIGENEPLLVAEYDGGTAVTVRERGGSGVMVVSVAAPTAVKAMERDDG